MTATAKETEVVLKELEDSVRALSPAALEHLAGVVAKAQRKNHPMPQWKKKLYACFAAGLVVWVLVHYMHYEACREKYPQASGWVCMVSPH